MGMWLHWWDLCFCFPVGRWEDKYCTRSTTTTLNSHKCPRDQCQWGPALLQYCHVVWPPKFSGAGIEIHSLLYIPPQFFHQLREKSWPPAIHSWSINPNWYQVVSASDVCILMELHPLGSVSNCPSISSEGLHQVWAEWWRTTSSVSWVVEDYIKCELSGGGLHQVWAEWWRIWRISWHLNIFYDIFIVASTLHTYLHVGYCWLIPCTKSCSLILHILLLLLTAPGSDQLQPPSRTW